MRAHEEIAAVRVRRLAAVLAPGALLTLLAGCGLKGPLYLPERNGTVITRPASPAPAESPAEESPSQPAPESETTDSDGDDKGSAQDTQRSR